MNVIELFAGVGGFRVGLERADRDRFRVVWSNQWEPSKKTQSASHIYTSRFGEENHSNEDIAKVPTAEIPDHDLLVGGFPCQDYSVASTLNRSGGIQGKKGVLWWEIHRILAEKAHPPGYVFLENVDRLLKSPAKQRGRDFAIMLASLADLGYVVEWRVINAADYGMPQRRRRTFILAYRQGTALYQEATALESPADWVLESGVMANAFPVEGGKASVRAFEITGTLAAITEGFNADRPTWAPFLNSGIIIGRHVHTLDVSPQYDGVYQTLGSQILLNGAVPPSYYIPEEELDRWNYLKGAKKEKRVNKTNGFEYHYNEGAMIFPDPLDKPSRTIITGEGGASPSRFKHVIRTEDGRLRRLTPLELERLNMFPDNHTAGASDAQRAFFMGNALVVGIIEKIGRELSRRVVD